MTQPGIEMLFFFFFFITLGLELSDTKVHEPQIRALLGTASYSLASKCALEKRTAKTAVLWQCESAE